LEDDGAPLLPGTLCCFPPSEDSDHGGWHQRFAERLAELQRRAEDDPYANPIQLLALDIGRSVAKGELSLSALEQLIQRLGVATFRDRAGRLGRRLGECDPIVNAARIEGVVRRLAVGRSFPAFKAVVEREHFGVVTTAHPTFGLTADLLRIAAKLAAGREETG